MIAFLILLLIAVIFSIVGGVLLYFRGRMRHKAALMDQTKTTSAADVASVPPGTLVEVKGTLRCEKPLVSDQAGETCAYYQSTVTREYRKPDYDDDHAGSDRGTETLAQNTRFAPFSVEDGTGMVAVDADGAEMDAKQIVDRFERYTGNEGPSITLGGTTLHLGGGERTIGYRYTETILPVDAPVYVLGVVKEDGTIGASPSGDRAHRFVVSYRSEEALGQSLRKTTLWLGVGGAGAFALSAILLVIGIVVLLVV